MGMIGYAMYHTEEHKRSEGIATLEKREDIYGHLISETEQCVATPKQSDKCYHLFDVVGITKRSKNDLAINKGERVHALY